MVKYLRKIFYFSKYLLTSFFYKNVQTFWKNNCKAWDLIVKLIENYRSFLASYRQKPNNYSAKLENLNSWKAWKAFFWFNRLILSFFISRLEQRQSEECCWCYSVCFSLIKATIKSPTKGKYAFSFNNKFIFCKLTVIQY